MDRLIVLDQGRIVEEGDHQTLLAAGGLYARLWAHQSGGFLVDEEREFGQDATIDAIGSLDEAFANSVAALRREQPTDRDGKDLRAV